MKTVRLIAVSVFFAAIFAVSALAQTTSAAKIGLINSEAFYDAKTGISKLATASTSLETEFKPVSTELQTLGTKIQTLEKELAGYRDIINKGGKIPISDADLNKKAEDYDKSVREYKFKEEGAKAQYQRREQIVMGLIRQDIGAAIQEFTKKNGYVLIVDVSKDNTGIFIGLDEAADVTKAFITFYNARPATTATVTK